MAQLDRLLVRIEGDASQLSTSLGGAQQRVAAASAVIQRSLDGVSASTRRLAPILQQAGFQVGDFAVQIASGTSPLRAFIQQGTQIAGAFGPWGAVIGAAGAVVGSLVTSLGLFEDEAEDAKGAANSFAESQKRLADAIESASQKLLSQRGTFAEWQADLNELLQKQAQFDLASSGTVLAGLQRQRDALGGLSPAQQEMGMDLDVIDPVRAAEIRDIEEQISAEKARQADYQLQLNKLALQQRDLLLSITAEEKAGAALKSGSSGGRDGGADNSRRGIPDLRRIEKSSEDWRKLWIVANAAADTQDDYADSIEGVRVATDDGMAALARLGQTLANLVTGATDAKSALGSIIQFLFEQLQQGVSGGGGIFGSLLGGLLGGIGGGGGSPAIPPTFDLGGNIIPGFAKGGTIGAREFGIVGERGPELIRGPAVVTPMKNVGPTVFIDARGADEAGLRRLEKVVRELNGSIERRAIAATLDAKQRGGAYARAFGGGGGS